MEVETPYLSVDALSRHFNVTVSTIRVWVNRGYITPKAYLRIGDRGPLRFNLAKTVADLEAYTQREAAKTAKAKTKTTSGATPIVDVPTD